MNSNPMLRPVSKLLEYLQKDAPKVILVTQVMIILKGLSEFLGPEGEDHLALQVKRGSNKECLNCGASVKGRWSYCSQCSDPSIFKKYEEGT